MRHSSEIKDKLHPAMIVLILSPEDQTILTEDLGSRMIH